MKSAIAKGYFAICIEDACWDAAQSQRVSGIKSANYNVICKTADVLAFE